ncbi:MAG: hypothetical protein HQK78_18315 [Desulfobacterales bacterium]|nr:hypothetical protein [Desulfobacterales bacterium]
MDLEIKQHKLHILRDYIKMLEARYSNPKLKASYKALKIEMSAALEKRLREIENSCDISESCGL